MTMRRIPLATIAVLLPLVLVACQPPAGAEADARGGADVAVDSKAPAIDAGTTRGSGTVQSGPILRYQCEELAVGARFSADGDSVELAYSGQRRTLAGGGAEYADAGGNLFRSGERVSLTLAGEPARECSPTDHVSPWEAAAGRGIAFRAVGQEPGWLVEVDNGTPPALSAQLDYGERSIQVAQADLLDDGAGFRGETDDGTPIRLEIAREACADPMSGERFEAAARLRVGEREYHGCGAYLEH